MAVPRPVILALVGVALLAGVFVLTRKSSDSNGTIAPAPSATAVHPAPQPVHPQKAAPKPAPTRSATAARPAHRAPAHARPAKQPSSAGAAHPRLVVQPLSLSSVVQDLDQGDVVVLSFSQVRGADDVETRAALTSLIGQPQVAIFYATLSDLTSFRPLLQGVGISQVPAVVVMRAGRPARLIEGFVDGGTLRQVVADARG